MKKCLVLLLLVCVNNVAFAMKPDSKPGMFGMLAGVAAIARGRLLVTSMDASVQTDTVEAAQKTGTAHDDKSVAYADLEEVAFFADPLFYNPSWGEDPVVFHKRDIQLLNSGLITRESKKVGKSRLNFESVHAMAFIGLHNLEECLETCSGDIADLKTKIIAQCDKRNQQDFLHALKFLEADELTKEVSCVSVLTTSGTSTASRSAGEFCIKAEGIKETFADYVGEVPEAVTQLMAYLKDPAMFIAWGVPCVNGILFEGPPGTGKTLLARVLAHEAGCPFFYIAASQIQKKYWGESEGLIKKLFDDARAAAKEAKKPAIVFIDEIDAMGTRPTDDSSSALGHRSVFNQLLTEMDGFNTKGDKNVVVIAATNRADMLDEALKRPGRFDDRITFVLPNVKVRAALFKKKLEKIKLREDVGSSKGITTLDALCAELAGITEGFSPADITNCVDQARRSAALAHEPLPVAVETLGKYLKSAAAKARPKTTEKMSDEACSLYG